MSRRQVPPSNHKSRFTDVTPRASSEKIPSLHFTMRLGIPCVQLLLVVLNRRSGVTMRVGWVDFCGISHIDVAPQEYTKYAKPITRHLLIDKSKTKTSDTANATVSSTIIYSSIQVKAWISNFIDLKQYHAIAAPSRNSMLRMVS